MLHLQALVSRVGGFVCSLHIFGRTWAVAFVVCLFGFEVFGKKSHEASRFCSSATLSKPRLRGCAAQRALHLLSSHVLFVHLQETAACRSVSGYVG